jgi:hypothetical protein
MSYTHGSFTVDLSEYYSYLPMGTSVSILSGAPTECYVPMRFWFSKNPGLALPLIALQYHEVKLNLTFAESSKWVKAFPGTTVNTNISSFKIFAD